MRRIVERIVAKFRGEPTPPAYQPLSPTAPAAEERRAGSVVAGGSTEIDGVRFILVSHPDDLVFVVATQPRVALRLHTLDYQKVMGSLIRGFDSKYDRAAPEQRALKYAALACGGCGWEFPGSYTMSLLDMFGSSFVVGGTSGFVQFGKTGRCPRCGSKESVLLYEFFAPPEIGEQDVAALGRYWRELGRRWWLNTGRQEAICDRCNRTMSRGEGSLVGGGNLQCAGCMDDYISGALGELRANPYHYGATELRKARGFEAQ
ncbi:MAG TPA: hypothetical protein VHU91_06505 [Mycobacteriales bacterium]|nr:hypothetical protein [Mycobacteriales bacterium]